MNQKSARHAILEEWEKLPEERRLTEDQAVAFIFNLMGRRPELFQFKYRKNPVETILSWLLPGKSASGSSEQSCEEEAPYPETDPAGETPEPPHLDGGRA